MIVAHFDNLLFDFASFFLQTCQVNLEGQSFFAKNGKPYCKKHSATGRF